MDKYILLSQRHCEVDRTQVTNISTSYCFNVEFKCQSTLCHTHTIEKLHPNEGVELSIT